MEEKDDLFERKINETGRNTLQKIFILRRLVFWATITAETLILVYTFINYFRYRDYGMNDGNSTFFWTTRIYTIYVIIYSMLMVLQAYYFLNFGKQAKRSIELNDAYSFNQCFTWIRRALIAGLVLIFVDALYFIQLFFWV